MWEKLGIALDHFIRTSDPKHHETVRWLFERCLDNGYIYKGCYTGQYCVSRRALRQRRQARRSLPRLRPPHRNRHRRELLSSNSRHSPESCWNYYEDDPEFIQPESRRNEVISFVRGGLKDLSITPHHHQMGHPRSGEGKHVVLCLVRCARSRYISAVEGEESLARRPAPDRQGNPAFPRRLLARVPDGGRSAAAQAHLRPRLAAVRRTTR